MCIIAGYSGNQNAAPILIEMMKKEEYVDGGLSTGIATIHEGKLYVRKVVGDVETLLSETDALDLPGTTGIIHSRTGGDYVQRAHPFTSNNGKIALLTNGTTRECACPEYYAKSNEVMAHFYNRGFEIKTAVDAADGVIPKHVLPNGKSYMMTEPYLFMIEEYLEGCSGENMRDDIAKATRHAINTIPRNFLVANVHADIPDTVTVGTIARPVSVGFSEGETFFASLALALPERAAKNPVVHLPPTTVAQITPSGLDIKFTSIENARVEQIDYRIAAFVYNEMERMLTGKKDAPLSIYDLPFFSDWENVWSEPHIDSIYSSGVGCLKPYAPMMYEALWSFHKQGRLHSILGTKTTRSGKVNKITRFWLD